VPLLIFILS